MTMTLVVLRKKISVIFLDRADLLFGLQGDQSHLSHRKTHLHPVITSLQLSRAERIWRIFSFNKADQIAKFILRCLPSYTSSSSSCTPGQSSMSADCCGPHAGGQLSNLTPPLPCVKEVCPDKGL